MKQILQRIILIGTMGVCATLISTLLHAGSGPPPSIPTPPLILAQVTPSQFLPVIMKDKGSCPQTICNGDFENGPDGSWLVASSNSLGDFVIVNLADFGISNHSGNFSAWLGGDPAEVTTITQHITVPVDAVQLSYWYWIDSNDSLGKSKGTVTLDTTPIKTYDLGQVTTGWTNEKLDIPANFRGKAMDIIFKAEIAPDPTGVFISSFLLDDVSILGPQTPLTLKGPGQTLTTGAPHSPGLKKPASPSAGKGR
jgi:hypothetical protein